MNRVFVPALLLTIGFVGAAPVDAEPYSAHCVGWWGWYWDEPAPGQVTVRSEAPHNVCGGYSTGCPGGIPACAGFVEGAFVVPYGPDRCAPIINAGPMVILGGVVVVGVFPDGEGDVWSIDGVFVGTTCLNAPVRGVFYASETGL